MQNLKKKKKMSLTPYMVGADITALTGEADPTQG